MLPKLSTIVAIVYLANSAWGYFTISGDTRLVKGKEDEPFNYATTLPGNYTMLESGIHEVTFVGGNCSTPFFECTYVQDDDTQMTVNMRGYMSKGLKWVTFSGASNLIPISVVFFTNNIWNDLASSSIQPQYAVPLVVSARGMHTVTLTCSIFSTTATYKLYLYSNKTEYYSAGLLATVSKVKDFPQILNLETRNVLLHKVITLTVKQKDPIDFYACNTGNYWLTHTIDWTRTQSRGSTFRASALAIMATLLWARL